MIQVYSNSYVIIKYYYLTSTNHNTNEIKYDNPRKLGPLVFKLQAK